MEDTSRVDALQKPKRRVVSTKYPLDRIGLLKAVQARRGDQFVSQTVEHALDQLIEKHFPGSVEVAA